MWCPLLNTAFVSLTEDRTPIGLNLLVLEIDISHIKEWTKREKGFYFKEFYLFACCSLVFFIRWLEMVVLLDIYLAVVSCNVYGCCFISINTTKNKLLSFIFNQNKQV